MIAFPSLRPWLPVGLPFLLIACGSALEPQVRDSSGTPLRAVASGAQPLRGDYVHHAAAQAFIERMAREEHFNPEALRKLLAQVERQPWILRFVNRPKRQKNTGPTGAWTRYRATFLTPANVSNGARFWRRYEQALQRAEQRYGVPPEYVVAILGVETRYGRVLGKHRVIDALATLAFDYPRRSAFFTDELAAFLVMAREEGLDPLAPKGSYAGAMGYGQFMPSSFHRWAVDFDGNGRRDLWNPVDAIGSVANYFAAHGWQKGAPVVVPAKVQGTRVSALKTGYDTRYSLEELQRYGIQPSQPLAVTEGLRLIRLDAAGGYEYWLGLNNFYVITRYNHSSYYAMVVHQLAQRIRKRYQQEASNSYLSKQLSNRLGQAL